ncbi:ERI1 exoribonuclease 2 [Rhynchonycteris naso]
MATKKLARQLGLIRRKSVAPANENLGKSKFKQLFDYLIVIDFESTCWNDGKHHLTQEIILLNTSTGEIESEFHAYVQPQEHPVLSEFCMELTGIKQAQVDEGVPLKICLSQFCKWIQKIQQQKKIIFATGVSDLSTSGVKLCAFVTWSDWDLGVCLEYECKRKQLLKPVFLTTWIDLRVTYKNFYKRKPKGLRGALQEVGIEFSGREHSGLDDSRNTALLAWKMIRDGCLMKITRSLNKVPTKKNPNILARDVNPNQVEETSARSSRVQSFSTCGTKSPTRSHENVQYEALHDSGATALSRPQYPCVEAEKERAPGADHRIDVLNHQFRREPLGQDEPVGPPASDPLAQLWNRFSRQWSLVRPGPRVRQEGKGDLGLTDPELTDPQRCVQDVPEDLG